MLSTDSYGMVNVLIADVPIPMPEYLLLMGNCETMKAGRLEPKRATAMRRNP